MRTEQPADLAMAHTARPPYPRPSAGAVTHPIGAARSALIAVTAVVVLLLTAACGSGSASGPAKTPTPYDAAVLVAGATRNTPVPTLSDTVRKDLIAIMLAGHPVDVVQVSGEPQVLNPDDLGLETISGGTGTAAGNQAITEDNLNAISQVIASAPNADGASYFEALMMAADKAAARGATSPYLVLIGSGLDDQGGLSFIPAGMLGADAAEVVSQLRAAGTLANPERLRGTTVVLSGFGYTAQDQAALTDVQRASEIRIWVACLEAVGAAVIVDPDPRTGPSVETDHTVIPVPVPDAVVVTPTATCTTEEYVFDGQSEVTFVANESVFVDPVAARSALDPLAAWLTAEPGRSAVIRGTTANDGSPASDLVATGSARAQGVADYVVSLGVNPAQLTVVGVGSDFPEYVMPDRDPTTGALLAGPAVLNRSVRIALTDPC